MVIWHAMTLIVTSFNVVLTYDTEWINEASDWKVCNGQVDDEYITHSAQSLWTIDTSSHRNIFTSVKYKFQDKICDMGKNIHWINKLCLSFN